jgi:hypothetical protein
VKLTAKQRRFAEEYVRLRNATEAAKLAGYSAKTAYAQGHRLLKKAEIQAAVEKGLARLQERSEVTATDVIQGLAREAGFHGKGASHGARVSAWSWLGKHFDLFVERHAHEGEIDLHVDSNARDFARRLDTLAGRVGDRNVASGDRGQPSGNGAGRAAGRAG